MIADARHIAALDLAARGLFVFPITANGKSPPLVQDWERAATTDSAQINQWALDYPGCNWGWAPGRSGHVVFDLDRKKGKDGVAELARLAAEHGFDLSDTLTVETPTAGLHLVTNGTAQNSAGKIAPGIDVRGCGGYLVAPGSTIDGKAYRITHDVELWAIPDAPAPLLAAAKDKKLMAQPALANVALDLPTNVGRAQRLLTDYVERGHVAVEGQGGDDRTYQVCAEVLSFGLTNETALDLIDENWNRHCVPPWPRDELETKLVNAAAYAQNEVGALAVAPGKEAFAAYLKGAAVADADAFPIGAPSWGFALHDPVTDATLPPITYRDTNKLWPNSPGRTVTQVIAQPKHHKTNGTMAELFRLMMSAGARVLMLALEGGYGVRTMRVKALADHYGIPLADLRGRFQVARIVEGGMFDLSNAECLRAFAAFVKAGGWTDVFIDTQHRAAGALEENSATDARVLWNGVEYVRRHGDCNIVLAHHQGKDASKGGRGSSADLASVDQQIALDFDRDTMTVTAKVTARKDGVDGFEVPFRVYQPNPNAVPILLPISAVEYDALTAVPDKITPAAIGAALRDMNSVGRDRAVVTHVLARHILHMRDELPGDPEEAEKATTNLQKRILDRMKAGSFKGYAERVGGHKNAGWLWSLPDVEGEGTSDV